MNQVEQRHAEMAKTLRVLHDDAQVRLHETAQRVFITVLLNAPAKLPLVVRSARGRLRFREGKREGLAIQTLTIRTS